MNGLTMKQCLMPTALMVMMLLLSGCISFNPEEARQQHIGDFSNSLSDLAVEHLNRPLSLDDCIAIAMMNNYTVRTAELDRKLGQLGRDLSFTAFLPNVAATAGYTLHAKEPLMQDKHAASGSINAGVPLFMPSSWFLYSAAKHGKVSSEIAAAYVRQGIVLQTTVNYFNVLVQDETIVALETQLASANEEFERIEGLAGEGFFTDWERDQARFMAETREAELNVARRQRAVLRGNFLIDLGLSPMADVMLSGDVGTVERAAGTVADHVLTALTVHPELALADRAVIIGEENVRKAFTDFLPTLSLTAALNWTTDDLAKHSANWATGFGAVWNVFTGFANQTLYRASKIERDRSRLELESTFLSVMIRVVSAEAAIDNAVEREQILGRAYEVARARHADYAAKAQEGLLPLSDALDARSKMELAQVEHLRARYDARIALANLELAMGLTALPEPGA